MPHTHKATKLTLSNSSPSQIDKKTKVQPLRLTQH